MNIVRLPRETERALNEIADKIECSYARVTIQPRVAYFTGQRFEKQRWQETLGALKSSTEGRLIDGYQIHEWLRSWGTPEEQAPLERGE